MLRLRSLSGVVVVALSELKVAGLWNNTVVIFVSDNRFAGGYVCVSGWLIRNLRMLEYLVHRDNQKKFKFT